MRVHRDGLRHRTVIIIVGVGNEIITFTRGPQALFAGWIDSWGGHLLPGESAKAAAIREANEELDLHFGVYGIRIDAWLDPIGREGQFSVDEVTNDNGVKIHNVENSTLFTLKLPNHPALEIRPKDDDKTGSTTVAIDGPLKKWTWSEIIDVYLNNPKRISDGLGRVLAEMVRNPVGPNPMRYKLMQAFPDPSLENFLATAEKSGIIG